MQSIINLSLIKDSSEKKKLTFLIVLASRMFNSYFHFFKLTNFGNPNTLELIKEQAIRYLLFDEYNEDLLQDLKIELDNIAPNSEKFESIESNYALTCCCIYYDILEFILNKDTERAIISGSELSENMVYVFIEDLLYNKNEIVSDEAVTTHELMQIEISFQNEIINKIISTKNEELSSLLKIKYNDCIIL